MPARVEVPPATAVAWRDVVTGQVKPQFGFMAANILLMRLARSYQADPTAGAASRCAEELRELFARNAHLPVVEKDVRTLFGK